MIERQAAIDAVTDELDMIDHVPQWVFDRLEGRLKQLPSAQPEIVRCRDCKHFEYDHPYVIQGVPVLGHLVCNRWGDGCKTYEDGFCFMGERREDD